MCYINRILFVFLQASERVAQNLKAVASGKYLDNYTKFSTVAKNVCEIGGTVQANPLNV